MGQCLSLYENEKIQRLERLERTVTLQQRRLDEYSKTQSKLLKIIDSRIEAEQVINKCTGNESAGENTPPVAIDQISRDSSTSPTFDSDSEPEFNIIDLQEYLKDFNCEQLLE